MPQITVLPHNRILEARPGQTLHALLAKEGLLDAPCGGHGTCGKCRVTADGRETLACRTPVDRDMTVILPQSKIQNAGAVAAKRIAFDIGTTSVVCYLLDEAGSVLAQASARNPQAAFGADVISRIRAAQAGHRETLTQLIRQCAGGLLHQICSTPEQVQIISLVGNPAMQQLFLGMEVDNLARVPFAHALCKPFAMPAGDIFPGCPNAQLLTVPDISGFVGADTVAGILSCGLHEADALTLLVDIGTNGEMVLGSRQGMIACSTAAGPALEGAGIQFGMRAEPGAIGKVWTEQGKLQCSVIGGTQAIGICGSGLIDAVAAALDLGLMNRRGRILGCDRIMLTNGLYLTQQDIRRVQLAKGAIAAGIRLLTDTMGVTLTQIQRVILAGAFGSALSPESACRIGLLPEELLDRIVPAGNAAGKGAVMLAAAPDLLTLTGCIAEKAEFLELASLPAFPKTFAKAMELPPNWLSCAKALGFDYACALDPSLLQARADVREMCAQNKCRAYGKNWTCPPHCGTLEACEEKMHRYTRGILLQTVGQLSKDIDSRAYRETERRHLESFRNFCSAIRSQHPDALCLGSGGCRICTPCAWPEACRFPEKAMSSMEGYGLFVTQVCRDCGAKYRHGERTVTFTACVLYEERGNHAKNSN